MGCVSSTFLEDEEGNVVPGPGHHIVSLTSTTYGLLTTLDHPTSQTPPSSSLSPSPSPSPPPPPPPPPSFFSSPHTPATSRTEPEAINFWELMAGLELSGPSKTPTSLTPKPTKLSGKENAHRAISFYPSSAEALRKANNVLRPSNALNSMWPCERYTREMFEKTWPLGGEHAAVLYTTTLRGIRKTFEDCNAVRAALEGFGVCVRERDVSMDAGFREELRELMRSRAEAPAVPPRLFVRGRYVGGAEEVLRMHEEGGLAKVLEGLPRARSGGGSCGCCGGARFLPCFHCSGSRKVVAAVQKDKVVRCTECNENGLVQCPICS